MPANRTADRQAAAARRAASPWVVLAVIVAAFAVYWGTAAQLGRTATPSFAYFDELAASFLAGRLDLAEPSSTHDLVQHDGRWYVPFPPLPALLLLPWVATAGVDGVSTVLFSCLLAALNVGLVYLLLAALARRGWTRLGPADNLWLTAAFAFSTAHWFLAPMGWVWFVAQITTVTFVALAYWSAARGGSPWLSGTALALAMLARPVVALAWCGLAGMAFENGDGAAPKQRQLWWGWAWRSLVPGFLAAAALLGYNAVRFGDPLDFGYRAANVAGFLQDDLRAHGQFDPHFLGRNLDTMLLATPQWDQEVGFLVPRVEGMSLLLTTPVLLFLVRARRRSAVVVGAWIAVGLLLVPLLLYYNTGAWQLGYRFSMDFVVPLWVLLAVAARERVAWPMRALILAGIAVNAAGVLWWFSVV